MIDEAMLLRESAYNLSGQDPQETKAVMQGAASKIDELRSMLAERDAEIGLLNSTLESRNRNIETLSEVSTAQRKLLEQVQSGMTLRDIFAAKALPTAIEHWKNVDADEYDGGAFEWESCEDGEETYSHDCLYAAEWTYLMADAMLEARKPKEQP